MLIRQQSLLFSLYDIFIFISIEFVFVCGIAYFINFLFLIFRNMLLLFYYYYYYYYYIILILLIQIPDF
jgi:hypothetical protein